MKRALLCGIAALALSAPAFGAPNVANATQKGSLLVFPLIVATGSFNTLVRIQNDGSSDVDLKCYWMDYNKNRVDFILTVTRNQATWFDARTGGGSSQVNPMPASPANGFDNPFFSGGPGATRLGMLACWAVDAGAQNQVKWNHLSGTATVYSAVSGNVEYNAYAFFAPTGTDLTPVGTPGVLNLNGVEYDSCPQYLIGQFSPDDATNGPQGMTIVNAEVNVLGCTLNLQQDWTPVWTKLQFDVWNEDEVKFTGAFECADTWHDTSLGAPAGPIGGLTGAAFVEGVDSASQNFDLLNLVTFANRYRVQGVKSAQCEGTETVTNNPANYKTIVTQPVGLVGVQSTFMRLGGGPIINTATTLAGAGKFTGKITWDAASAVPEGGVR